MSEKANPTILVVDDDVAVRGLFRITLESCGYKVQTSSNGKEGMNQLRQNAAIDLLVTDLVMPEQEGLETIVGARREFPKLKILVVSGYGEYFRVAKLCGAYDCMLKPVELTVLVSKVRELVERI
jgi:DNA-binding NtrC family response regulator